jgi:hypothetical protein
MSAPPPSAATAPAAPGRSFTTLRPADDRHFADTARKLAVGDASSADAKAKDTTQTNAPLQFAAAEIPVPVPRPPDIEEVNRAMAAFAAPADGDDAGSASATKNDGASAAESKDDAKSAAKHDSKIKHREAYAKRMHRPSYRMTAQRDGTAYRGPDGRRFRVFGRLDDQDYDRAPSPFFW